MSQDRSETLQLIIRLCCLGLLLGILLSYPLWTADRTVPMVPLLPFTWGTLATGLLVSGMVVPLAIIGVTGAVRSGLAWIGLGCLVLLIITDISRFQPWVYEYVVILALLALVTKAGDQPATLRCFQLLLGAIYFWSGVHKINLAFPIVGFPWLATPAASLLGLSQDSFILFVAGLVSILVEIGVGLTLLTNRLRRVGLIAAIGTHIVILVLIGPLGHNWNQVVWPWNVIMILFCLILYRSKVEPVAITKPQRIFVLLFWAAPVLNFVGWWNHYPSFSLYSEVPSLAFVTMPEERARRLDPTGDNIVKVADGRATLRMLHWSMKELRAPIYPEVWVYRAVFSEFCRTGTSDLEMTMEHRYRFSEWRYETIRCGDVS